MKFNLEYALAEKFDRDDPLAAFRSRFLIPKKDGKEVIYLCGNSLGLQPKSTRGFVEEELNKWEELAVEGHFKGIRPWADYHLYAKKGLSHLIGSGPDEVVNMGSLTENLHILLNSFYLPEGNRRKILIEKMAFPSDHYAILSQLQIHGYGKDELIEIEPDQGNNYSTEHIIQIIESHQHELALVLLPGIQYYTGQFFNITDIALAAHKVGAIIGFDLAHAIGNVPLTMHESMVDFATWCSYKYLNSGPGGISGIFVHEKHLTPNRKQHLKGWWGHDRQTRFKMDNHWSPAEGVDAWQLSNPNILSSAANLASLEILEEANIQVLREKSKLLTGYLEYLLLNTPVISDQVEIITPTNPEARGAQLSLKIQKVSHELIGKLTQRGIILDYREPDVIRVAPVPLYNTFTDVWNFVSIITAILKE